jgi:hypothetical protein
MHQIMTGYEAGWPSKRRLEEEKLRSAVSLLKYPGRRSIVERSAHVDSHYH